VKKNSFKIHKEDFLIFRDSTDEIWIITQKIQKLLRGKKIKKFLDVGVGSGELTSLLTSKLGVKDVVAIDKKNYVDKNKKFIFFQTDWLNFCYPAKFDLIVSSHSISYLAGDDIKKSIKKIRGFLKKAGVAILIIYDNSASATWTKFKKIFYPSDAISTINYIKPAISRYKFKEDNFTTRVYADNLEHMLKIGRFLAEKHLPSYLKSKNKIKQFFKKYRKTNGKIILPLKHKMYILSK